MEFLSRCHSTLSGDFSVDTSQVVERLAADLDVPVMGGDVADSDAAACYFASPGVRLQWSR